MADVVRLPEPVPEGWAPSSLFAGEWTRPFGPPPDVPTRIGEVRGYLWVGLVVERMGPVPQGRIHIDGTDPIVVVPFWVDVVLQPPGFDLADACAAVERAFCGCVVRR